jgi:hypothetical protein
VDHRAAGKVESAPLEEQTRVGEHAVEGSLSSDLCIAICGFSNFSICSALLSARPRRS